MDSQGFAPSQSGLVPSNAAPAFRPPTRVDKAKGTLYTANEAMGGKREQEDGTIRVFRGIQGGTSMLWFGQFVAMLLGGVAWCLGKAGWHNGSFALKRWIQAPMNALFTTTIRETTKLPMNTVRSAADFARELNGDIAAKHAKPLEAKAAGWKTWGDGAAKRIANFFKPMREGIKKWIDGFSKDSWLGKRLHNFTEGRIKAHEPKVGTAIDGVLDGLKGAPKKGNILMPAKETPDVVKKAFKPVADLLEKAKKANPANKVKFLEQAEKKAAEIAKGLTGAEAKAAHGLRDTVTGARRSASILLNHIEARGGSLSGMAKNVLRIGGRIPLFYAIVGVGAAAAGVAAALVAKRDNRLARKALQDMKEDIGDANHPIIQQASKIEKKQGSSRWLGAGLETVSQGAYVAPINGPMGFLAIMGASELPKVTQLIMPENRSLSAYMMLKKAEAGKAPLPPQQKTELVRHLVTCVPALEKQGGQYNRLSAPIAAAIVERKMSVRDTMRFLANQDEFMKLANDVAAKQKQIDALAAEKKAAAEKAKAITTPVDGKTSATPADGKPVSSVSPTTVAPAAPTEEKPAVTADTPVAPVTNEKPSMKISAAQGTSQGKLVEAQRLLGQV